MASAVAHAPLEDAGAAPAVLLPLLPNAAASATPSAASFAGMDAPTAEAKLDAAAPASDAFTDDDGDDAPPAALPLTARVVGAAARAGGVTEYEIVSTLPNGTTVASVFRRFSELAAADAVLGGRRSRVRLPPKTLRPMRSEAAIEARRAGLDAWLRGALAGRASLDALPRAPALAVLLGLAEGPRFSVGVVGPPATRAARAAIVAAFAGHDAARAEAAAAGGVADYVVCVVRVAGVRARLALWLGDALDAGVVQGVLDCVDGGAAEGAGGGCGTAGGASLPRRIAIVCGGAPAGDAALGARLGAPAVRVLDAAREGVEAVLDVLALVAGVDAKALARV